MKKLFATPELEVVKFTTEDILTLSDLIGEEDSDEAIDMPKT
jgi:hypothetical protein